MLRKYQILLYDNLALFNHFWNELFDWNFNRETILCIMIELVNLHHVKHIVCWSQKITIFRTFYLILINLIIRSFLMMFWLQISPRRYATNSMGICIGEQYWYLLKQKLVLEINLLLVKFLSVDSQLFIAVRLSTKTTALYFRDFFTIHFFFVDKWTTILTMAAELKHNCMEC